MLCPRCGNSEWNSGISSCPNCGFKVRNDNQHESLQSIPQTPQINSLQSSAILPSEQRSSINIFFCYAHEDEKLLGQLKKHLKPMQKDGLINVWYDRDISAGTEWEEEINKRLNEAQIILLLISPDFMNSDYCYDIEMKRALQRHKNKEARVIPIILRHVDWQIKALRELQALPTDAIPVQSNIWHSEDEALFDVTKGVRKVVEELIARYRVLAVDDSPHIRHFVGNLLRQNGWKVRSARDGVEALEMLSRETPDVVLLGIEMPRMDGFELIAAVRSQERYRTLPLVVLSSRGSPKFKERAMQLGANAYLVKPCQSEELLNVLTSQVYNKTLKS